MAEVEMIYTSLVKFFNLKPDNAGAYWLWFPGEFVNARFLRAL